MFRLPLSMLSPAGARARLSVLIFHRVFASFDPMAPGEPLAAEFEQRMRWVRDWFNVLPLRDAVERLFAGTLPRRALAVTFDDGYADNEAVAAPILHKLGLTATFFVSTRYLDGGIMWNDEITEALRASERGSIDLHAVGHGVQQLADPAARCRVAEALIDQIKRLDPEERRSAVKAIVAAAGNPDPPRLMMTPQQVRRLVDWGMDVGAHTVSHPILARLEPAQAFDEIATSRDHLAALLGRPIPLFAYPNGVPGLDYAAEHARMVRECGFIAAVSTAWGAASMRSDRYQLPRFTPWDRTRWRYGARLLANLLRPQPQTA